MQFWTGFVLVIAGWYVPLVLSSSGASFNPDGELKKKMCSPFEVLKPSEPCCEPTCVDDCSHAVCRRAPVSDPTCVCRQGYVRHNGSCIRKESCPSPSNTLNPYVTYGSYESYRPVLNTKPTPTTRTTCENNETPTFCRPSCEATCENDCTGDPIPKTCIPEPSCVCKEGFVRYKDKCIQKCDCSKKQQRLALPLSGEYIDFEVVSLEGQKSGEDFDYPQKGASVAKDQSTIGRYNKIKPPMIPVYLRTVTSAPKSSGYDSNLHTTEQPVLHPTLCACRSKQPMHVPTFAPKLDEHPSYESTEEDCDIVPYVPPPVPSSPPLMATGSYARKSSTPLFPPNTAAASGAYYMPRKSVPVSSVHHVDLNEPLDHFYGSGQVSSAQQNSAGQDEYRKPLTIWPPVCYSCKRCGLNRKQR